MALDDLLRAIQTDADTERREAQEHTAAAAAALVEQARTQAAELEAELATAPERAAQTDADHTRAVARLRAAASVRRARELGFGTVVDGVRARLASARSTAGYPDLFATLLSQARAALPAAEELRVDPRDAELAASLAAGLRVDATLATAGGLELTGSDGRTVRNTIEVRLANAEPDLRQQFARWARAHDDSASAP